MRGKTRFLIYKGIFSEKWLKGREDIFGMTYYTALHYDPREKIYQQRPQLLLEISQRPGTEGSASATLTSQEDIARLLDDLGISKEDLESEDKATLRNRLKRFKAHIYSNRTGAELLALVKYEEDQNA